MEVDAGGFERGCIAAEAVGDVIALKVDDETGQVVVGDGADVFVFEIVEQVLEDGFITFDGVGGVGGLLVVQVSFYCFRE